MVMYNLGMNLIVRPIIRWHERRGEARGEARERERWEMWNQRRLEHQARGEPFDELPPPPPHRNCARQPED